MSAKKAIGLTIVIVIAFAIIGIADLWLFHAAR
jgi:hypothetical protein